MWSQLNKKLLLLLLSLLLLLLFGIRKVGASAQQVKPKLFLCNQLIRPQEINEPFEYLGRSFDFKMSNEEHKKRLTKNICEYMEIISALPLHPKNKLLIYQHYVLSKVSWDLTVANISMTWVKENLENKVSAYVRLWLELPISGTLDIISLTKSKYGLGYVPISSRFTQCQVTRFLNQQIRTFSIYLNQLVQDPIYNTTNTYLQKTQSWKFDQWKKRELKMN